MHVEENSRGNFIAGRSGVIPRSVGKEPLCLGVIASLGGYGPNHGIFVEIVSTLGKLHCNGCVTYIIIVNFDSCSGRFRNDLSFLRLIWHWLRRNRLIGTERMSRVWIRTSNREI